MLSTVIGFTIASNAAASAVAQEDVIYWSRPEFIIPFQVDSNGTPPREVILEASDDLGISWYTVSRGDVRTRQFRFSSPKNGDFIFRLKMVDDSGRTFSNPGEPLRIHVDTEKPTAKLTIDMDSYGDLNARIQIVESNLDRDSIKLEYQTEDSQEWQPISLDLSRNEKTDNWLGSATWAIPQTTRQLIVRLSGRDKAGNTFEVTRTPDIPKTAAGRSGIQFASQPNRDNSQSQVGIGAAIGSGAAVNNDGLPTVRILGRQDTVTSPSSTNQMGVQQQLIENQQKLIEQLLNQQRFEASARSLDTTLRSEQPIAPESRGIPDFGLPVSKRMEPQPFEIGPPALEDFKKSSANTATFPSNNSKTKTDGSPLRSLSDEELMAIGSRTNISDRTSRDPLAPRVAAMDGSSLDSSRAWDQQPLFHAPPRNDLNDGAFGSIPSSPTLGTPAQLSSQPLYSGTRAFSLEYGIENDLGVPVRTVELWGTSDAGKTWDYWGDDPDRTTPFDIEVQEDGLFGFRMVIVGNNGLAQNRPKNGDDADAWVKVDTTPPKVKLQSALYGRGPDAGSLIIEYLALDPDFGERPISLYYAQSFDGPWQEITTGLTNSGKYAWAANPNLPPEIYLKIRAVDASGNISEHVMDIPVKVQGIAPRGRIRGINGGLRPGTP